MTVKKWSRGGREKEKNAGNKRSTESVDCL